MRKFILFSILAIALGIFGCAAQTSGSFTMDAYKTLSVAGATYNSGMEMAAQADKAGMLKAATKADILKYGRAFYTSYILAQKTLLDYTVIGQSNATAMQEVSASLSVLGADLKLFNDAVAAVKAASE